MPDIIPLLLSDESHSGAIILLLQLILEFSADLMTTMTNLLLHYASDFSATRDKMLRLIQQNKILESFKWNNSFSKGAKRINTKI